MIFLIMISSFTWTLLNNWWNIAISNSFYLLQSIINFLISILPYLVWLWTIRFWISMSQNLLFNNYWWLTWKLIFDEIKPIKPIKKEVKKITPLDEAIKDTQKIMDYTKEIKKIQKKYKKPFRNTIFTINK